MNDYERQCFPAEKNENRETVRGYAEDNRTLLRAENDRDKVFKQLTATQALAQDILSMANDRLSAYRKPQPECGQESQGPCRDMAPVWGDFSEKIANLQAALHMIGAVIREAEL